MHAIVREACEIYDESVVTLLNQQFKRLFLCESANNKFFRVFSYENSYF